MKGSARSVGAAYAEAEECQHDARPFEPLRHWLLPSPYITPCPPPFTGPLPARCGQHCLRAHCRRRRIAARARPRVQGIRPRYQQTALYPVLILGRFTATFFAWYAFVASQAEARIEIRPRAEILGRMDSEGAAGCKRCPCAEGNVLGAASSWERLAAGTGLEVVGALVRRVLGTTSLRIGDEEPCLPPSRRWN
ncbi:hypothetical protein DFH09DRAFT_324183 [Mycena vulgaris]|nr:hypothetical protein DFH09DRAFT_324183 [Mycena vulgaris]